MMRVLFTGGGGAGTEAIWRIWRERYDMYFADADPKSILPDIPEHRRISIPMATHPDFMDSLQHVCEKYEVDLLVPGVDEELSNLASVNGSHEWPEIFLPDKPFVDLMLDKLSGAEAILSAGLTAPKTQIIEHADAVGFPIIAKPRYGRGSRHVMMLNSLDKVSAYLAIHPGGPGDYVAQEFSSGQEYTVFVAADNHARLRAVIPVKVALKRGITIRAQTDNEPAIIDYVRKFQECFEATGVYNIQCILTDEKKVLPFEVNPRISTTFCLAITTGFDPIKMNEQPVNDIFTPLESYRLQRNWVNTITKF